jgi:putative molybdopterin biosynthesis protein
MRVALKVDGRLGLGKREIGLVSTLELIEAIARVRSVRGAAERLGLSYRSAWGRLAELEAALGQPVAVKTKGHGSVLTAFGAAFRDALADAVDRFSISLPEEERSLERRLLALLGDPAPEMKVAVSHDPLLLDVLAGIGGIEVAVAGSLEAVGKLLSGAVDVAGFHFGGTDQAECGPMAQLFEDPSVSIVPLFRREQGLILASGNPLAIRSIEDLAGRRARFVNRQKGSGTRLWFDRLLREKQVGPERILGYEVEEFTHQAVAALVASGAADAGMGARSSADRFSLDFLPLGEETYFLAVRPSPMPSFIDRIVEEMRERLREAIGYAPAESRTGRS